MIKFVTKNDDETKFLTNTSSLLKRRLVYMLVQDELDDKRARDSALQLNYAAGRLVAVTKLLFLGSLNNARD